MKINIKDVLKNDTEKADLHSEHWLTDAMEAEEKSAPEESESAEVPDTDLDPGVEAYESEMPDTDSEEEIPEAEELAEEQMCIRDRCVWRSDQRCCDQFVSDRRDFNGRNGFHCCVFSGKEKSGCLEFYPHGECHCFSTGRFAVWMGQGPLLHYFSVHIDTDDTSALSGT